MRETTRPVQSIQQYTVLLDAFSQILLNEATYGLSVVSNKIVVASSSEYYCLLEMILRGKQTK